VQVGDLVRSVTENPLLDHTRGLGLVLAVHEGQYRARWVHHDRAGTVSRMNRSAKVKWCADYGTFWIHAIELEVISESR